MATPSAYKLVLSLILLAISSFPFSILVYHVGFGCEAFKRRIVANGQVWLPLRQVHAGGFEASKLIPKEKSAGIAGKSERKRKAKKEDMPQSDDLDEPSALGRKRVDR
jgi:hypothetical protein